MPEENQITLAQLRAYYFEYRDTELNPNDEEEYFFSECDMAKRVMEPFLTWLDEKIAAPASGVEPASRVLESHQS